MAWRSTLLFVLLLCAVGAAQTQPSESEQERRSEKTRIEAEVAKLPVIRADSIEQAAKLSVADEMLEAITSLQSESRESQVLLPDLKGVVRITLFGPRPPEMGGGSFFDLLQQDLTEPVAGQVYTRISAYAGRISIVRDSESEEWFTSVQLLQDAPPQPGMPMQQLPVRLYVHRTHSEEKVPTIRFTLEAGTFIVLRLRHIPEMDRYVRPILRDLGQERALFAVPDSIAWMALGSTSPPDPQFLAKIMSLVASLDADEFQQRARASRELTELGSPALIALTNLDRSKLSAQQNSEIATIIEESIPLTHDQFRALGNDKSFVLDALYTADSQLEKRAMDRLKTLVGQPVELTPSSTARERDSAIRKLRDQILPPTTQPVP